MIRKITTRDVVSKDSTPSEPTRRERDFLIERLTRKHTAASIVESPAKVTKNAARHRRDAGFSFKNFKFGQKWFWLSLPLVLIAILFVVLQFMVSAVLTVKPKELTVPIDAKLFASINATTSPSTISYQIITLSAADSQTVLATGTVATKPQKAGGQIIVFNSYSTAPQTLIKTTRFETADGLIYRTPDTIKIPGYTSSGGKIVPGSITISVTADKVGSNYNIDMTDFTIPGFKTDAGRYTKVFARSKTAMTGGSDGNSLGVSADARLAAQNDIETRLRTNLLGQAQAQKTANSVIFDTASKISFQHMPDTAGVDAQHVVIHEQGTISSVAFDKVALGKLLLGDAINTVGGKAQVSGMESLHFIAAVSATTPIWQALPFAFTLTGPLEVVGVVDTDKLLNDILGISHSDLGNVLANYPTIEKATANIKPFWKSSFPTDASKVKIEVLSQTAK